MTRIFLFSLLFITLIHNSFSQQFEWAKSFGGIYWDLPASLATDKFSNIYTVGTFTGIADFDPSSGIFNLGVSGSNRRAFLQKTNSSGNFLWAKDFGTNNDFAFTDITIDSNGIIFLVGDFSGSVDFDPGNSYYRVTSQGNRDAFILKLDLNGNFISVKTFGGYPPRGGSNSNVYISDIKIDTRGNIYVTGNFGMDVQSGFSSFVDFDPGRNVVIRGTPFHTGMFLSKLDSSGNLLYVVTGTGINLGLDLEVDGNENVYVIGSQKANNAYTDGSSIVRIGSFLSNNSKGFILKTDSVGNLVFVQYLSLPNFSRYGLSTSEIAPITIDIIRSTLVVTENVTGSYNSFIQYYSLNGTLSLTSFYPDRSITHSNLDDLGNIYITGIFQDTVDFDPGPGVRNLVSNGWASTYIQKLNPSRSLVFAESYGGTSRKIALDGLGNIYTVGYFGQTVDFDPGIGVSNLTAFGRNTYDCFIQKLSLCTSTNGIDVKSACNSYTWINGMTYTSSNNTATQTLTNAAGCDSVVTLNLTINNSTTGIDFQTACVSYTWINGVTYTSSNNTATHTLTNAQGCDSVVTLNLTINNSNTGVDVQTACDSYTWINGVTYTSSNNTATQILTNAAGCDSVVTLNLTINNSTTGIDVQTTCDSYTWINGVTYTSSNNTATDTLTNSLGCDSIVTLNLTINSSTTSTDVQTACDSYTWINGVTYTSSNNTATDTLTNSQGCDSIVTLNLTINNSTTGIDVQTACDSYTWINGVTYTSSNNTATDTLTNSQGCDSVVTLNLTINNSTTGIDTQTACDSYTWINGVTYTSSNNTATDTLTNSQGCDSVVTLNLTINNSTTGVDVQTACDSYTWINGVTYTSSNNTATDTLTNSQGCDSIVTLNLTINNSTTGIDVQTACDSYTWINGVTYTSSNNTATDTLTNAAGCDSIVTLNLTITNSTTGIDVLSACDSYTWINGVTYTSSNNTATQTLTNAVGCDSVVTLNLTLNNSNTGIDVITACDSYTWINGVAYTSSNNTATQTLTNSAGCDSVVTLNLTINNSTTGVDVQTACDSFTWINGVTYMSSNNTATDTLTNTQGCDSVVTLNLTITPTIFPTITFYRSLCENDPISSFTSTPIGGTWTGNGISGIGDFDPLIAGVGIHEIIYQAPGLCAAKDTVEIEVYASPDISAFLTDDQCNQRIGAIDITVTNGAPPYSFAWNFGSNNQNIIGLKEGNYTIVVTDSNGCFSSLTESILNLQDDSCDDTYVLVPNVFSPDGNGINDVIFVDGKNISKLNFSIYNRWGNQVFIGTEINEGWDGTYKGKPVSQGVFVYLVDGTYKDGSSFSQKGTITLIR